MTDRSTRCKAFTLFEVLIALAVFVLAALGIARAIAETIDAAMAARERSQGRALLESRLAFCLALPPKAGSPRRVQVAGCQVEETLQPFAATNAEGRLVKDLHQLTIATRVGSAAEKVSVLLYRPDSAGGTNP